MSRWRSRSIASCCTEVARTGALLAASLASVGVLLAGADLALQRVAPIANSTFGTPWSRNGERYGWGFEPGESLVMTDLDTGESVFSRTNAHGWRDRDHAFDGAPGTYRIVVLGDSHTFGVMTAADRTYPRLLERQLRDAGFDVEVIALALTGFGTDQELEVLRTEGLRYRPDLVIVQFCVNDLYDNDYHGRPDYVWHPKPFYYRLDAGGRLERHPNPDFTAAQVARGRPPTRWLMRNSEIARRLWFVVDRLRSPIEHIGDSRGLYRADPATLDQIRVVLGLADDAPLLRDLARLRGRIFDDVTAHGVIARHQLGARREDVLRILELHYFDALWRRTSFETPHPQRNAFVWRLYFALMEEMRRTVDDAGAKLVVFSDNDWSSYRWMREWRLIAPGEAVRRRFLEPTVLVREWARANEVGFAESVQPHTRARNDPHANAEGHAAIAANLRRYLLLHEGAVLGQHRVGAQRVASGGSAISTSRDCGTPPCARSR